MALLIFLATLLTLPAFLAFLATLSTAPNSDLRISMSSGSNSSSARGTPFLYGSRARCASSPIRPPTKMLHPGMAFFFPVSGSNFRAGAPMIPMSAHWTCPQLFGHPVQWILMGLSTVTFSSSFFTMLSALALVSMSANPQNCAPVQLTRFPSIMPGLAWNLDPAPRTDSFSKSSTRFLSTLGRMAFCSTVSRISPSEYSSARSASSRHSRGESLPAGMRTPTRTFPFWG
mmetsp:Transcript_33522/g.99904  ORF Transcript_33522/g.99904 Transcript_33522/m.99904 type:complete len:230 (+) Transcript_33522:529-1218(+)